ncbi:MAG: isoprenylcysteine carboxylmethyltransferase family protein [Burkholderiaceae bacterium]|jgi:protein-S-isoprenylcysteine O-methyltransferase Ste14|nr:isoprenylcysteine carboxylmethyltransferase family protein [Burkholderiaceae bacterium]
MLLKTIAVFLINFSIMGLSLFLPRMSLYYPLAWTYLAIFFGAAAIIACYLFLFDKDLLRKRLLSPIDEPRLLQKIIQLTAGVFTVCIYAVSAFDSRFKWSLVPFWVSCFSEIMVLVSFAILFFVFRQNRFLSTSVEIQENQKVVSTGLYGIVRHPMYFALSLQIIFTPPALGSYWAMILSGCLIAVLFFRAIDEEKTLKQSLPGYEEYCEKVKYRLIPLAL